MKFNVKRNDKIGFTFFLAFMITSALFYFFEEKFDEQIWKTRPQQRHKMLDYIVEEEIFINKSREEILKLLGKPERSSITGKDVFIYPLGSPPSFFTSEPTKMIITFSNNKVIRVSEFETD